MSALDEFAAFIVSSCDVRAEEIGTPGRADVKMILNATVLPDVTAKQAALYGFADEVGATEADGFDPGWNPRA